VGCTLLLDMGDIGRNLIRALGLDALVVAGVVTDLKPCVIEFFDLLPGEVACFICEKIEALRDEEGRTEAEFFKLGRDISGVIGH